MEPGQTAATMGEEASGVAGRGGEIMIDQARRERIPRVSLQDEV
jgi:hypothetical protein